MGSPPLARLQQPFGSLSWLGSFGPDRPLQIDTFLSNPIGIFVFIVNAKKTCPILSEALSLGLPHPFHPPSLPFGIPIVRPYGAHDRDIVPSSARRQARFRREGTVVGQGSKRKGSDRGGLRIANRESNGRPFSTILALRNGERCEGV